MRKTVEALAAVLLFAVMPMVDAIAERTRPLRRRLGLVDNSWGRR